MAIVDPFKSQSNSAGTGIVDPFKAPRATLQRPAPEAAKPEGFIDSAVAGFKRSLPETKALLGGAVGLAGDLVGLDSVRDYGLGVYSDTMEKDVAPLQTAEFTDVLEGNAGVGDFVGGAVGNFGGQLVQSAAAAGAGALAGAALGSPTGPGAAVTGTLGAIGGLVARKGAKEVVGELAEKLIADQVKKGVAREAAETGARATLQRIGLGAAAAPLALNIGQEAGGTYATAVDVAADEGRELTQADALRAGAAGVAGGLIDTVADATGIGALGGRFAGSVGGRVLKGALTQGAVEGATETVQQGLQRFGAQQDLTGDEAAREYLNSFAAGAVGGGAIGGAGGLRSPVEEPDTASAAPDQATKPAPVPVAPPSPTTEAALRIRAETGATPAEREAARTQLAAMLESQGRMIPGPGQTPINVTPQGEARTASQELGIAQQRAGELQQQAEVGLTPDVLAAQRNDPRATLQRFPDARPGSLADAANAITAAPNLTPVTGRPVDAKPAATEPAEAAAPVIPPGVDPQTGEVLPEQGEEAARRAIVAQLEQGRVIDPRMIAGATGITPRRASEIRSEIQQQRKAEAKAKTEGRAAPTAEVQTAEAPAQDLQQARPELSVRMGDQEYPVDSVEDASRKFLELKERGDIGGMQAVRLVDRNGAEVGFIGQSGEVYDTPLSGIRANPNAQPVYRPPSSGRGEPIDGDATPIAGDLPADPENAVSTNSPETAASDNQIAVSAADDNQPAPNAYGAAAAAIEAREPVEKALANLDDAQVRALGKALRKTFSPTARRAAMIEKLASVPRDEFAKAGLPALRQLAQQEQPAAAAAPASVPVEKPKPQRRAPRDKAPKLEGRADAPVDATAEVLARQQPDPEAAERFAKIDEGFAQNRERLAKAKFKKGETVSYMQSGEVKTGVIESIEKDQGMAMVGNSFVAVRRLFRPGEASPTPQSRGSALAVDEAPQVEAEQAARDERALDEAKKEWAENLGFKVGDRVRDKKGGPVRVVTDLFGKYVSYRVQPDNPSDLSSGSIKATDAIRVDEENGQADTTDAVAATASDAPQAAPRVSDADYAAALRTAKEAFTARAEKMKADPLKASMRRALGFRGVKPAGTRAALIEQGQQAIEAGDFDLVTDIGASVAPSVMSVLQARREGRVGRDDDGGRAEPAPTAEVAPVAAAAAEAATSPENDLPAPTEAQKEAGNYRKGHVVLNGLDISIENPAGSKRREEWPALAHHYGYIKRTEGADGDHVDVFMSDDAGNPDLPVFVVDQVTKEGRLDEQKVMLGFRSTKAAGDGYLANYTPGWNGIGAVTPTTWAGLKEWLRDGDTSRSFAGSAAAAKFGADAQQALANAGRADAEVASERSDGLSAEVTSGGRVDVPSVGSAGGRVDSAAQEGLADSSLADTGREGNRRKGGPASSSVDRGVDVPSGSPELVLADVDGLRSDLKIVDGVVQAVPVAVMDNLGALERPSDGGLDDQPVLEPLAANAVDDDADQSVRTTMPGEKADMSAGAGSAQGRTSRKTAKPNNTTDSAKVDGIDDFGETLLGARKHLAGEYAKRLEDAATLDVAAEPLSRTWPEPEYQKLLDNGADPFVVSFVRAMRDEIPRKPVAKWKVGGWANKVRELRSFAQALLADGDLGKKLAENLASPQYAGKLGEVKGRAELYQEVGHGRSLQGVRFGRHHYAVYRGEKDVTRWTVEKDRAASAYSNWPQELAVGKTREEALDAFRAFIAKEAEAEAQAGAEASGAKMPRFDIYSRRRGEGFIIGVRLRGGDALDLRRFTDVKEARAFLADEANKAVLAEEVRKLRDVPSVRGDLNAPRVGVDHRNGADVSPEQFGEAFGFRGVQFGNYVEVPRRQQDLNNAYDALMDLAGVIGVPPRALSLNGTLGLAFGARGSGGKNPAMAHFERGTVVINLTKGKGAGSLAHEWFHGLDNYFARQRGAPIGMATVEAKAGDAHRDVPMRPEMRAAFLRLVKAITDTGIKERSDALDKLRSKAYWGTKEEMAARAFESYVIAKLGEGGASNDYLANVVPEAAFSREGAYPYPTAAELPAIRGAFDDFFQTIETGPGQNGAVAMFSQPAQVDERLAEELEEYNNGSSFMSDRDLLERVEGIIQDSDTVPQSVRDAARRFRQEIREDEDEWGGRGDSLAAGEDFVAALEAAVGAQLSVPDAPAGGIDAAALDSAVRSVTEKWEGDAPPVTVAATPDALPEGLRGQPGTATAEGVYYRGRVYLIASNLSSEERAMQVLAHEAFGHYGVEAVVGERDWAAISRDVGAMLRDPSKQSDAMQEVLRSVRARYPKADPQTLAKETIAVMAEQGVQAGVLNRVLAAVRRFLRRLGLVDRFNESDLRDIVGRGMRHVKGPAALAAPRLRDVIAQGAPAFASPMSAPAVASRVLRLMARHDELFQYQRSNSQTLDGVFRDLGDGFEVENRGGLDISFEHGDYSGKYAVEAEVFQISQPGGKKARLFVERGGKNRMYLDISEFKSGEGVGAGVYAGLFNYAFNTGKVFIGDPTGLSDEALLRRTEQMLSAALKFGTTRMMEPHPRQVDPMMADGPYKPQRWAHPLEWVPGDDRHNIAALLETSYNNHRQFLAEVPGVNDALSDFSLGRDSGSRGGTLPDGELGRIAAEAGSRFAAYPGPSFGRPRAPAIGRASAARFLLTESVVRQAESPQRLGFLAETAEQLVTGSLNPQFRGIFYSQPGPDAAQAGEPLFSQPDPKAIDDLVGDAAKDPPLTDRIRQAFDDATKGGNLEDKARRALLYGVTLRHIAELGGKLLPSLKSYVDTVQQMATDRNAMQEDAAKIADTWERAQRKDRRGADDTANLMHDATVEGVDPDADYQPLTFSTFETMNEDGKATERRVERTLNRRNVEAEVQAIKRRTRGADDATKAKAKERIEQLEERLAQEQRRAAAYPLLAARWQALPDQWKQLYREARDAYSAQSKRYEDALVQRIEDLVEEGATRASYVAQIRQQFESQRLEGPYFPLARFGSFWISARTPNGEPAFFMYETKAEWRRAQADLKIRGYDIRAASEKFENVSSSNGPSSGFMADLMDTLGKAGVGQDAKDAVYQLYLRSLPDLSIRKHFIHRKKTTGYSADALRAFAGNLFHGSFQIARLRHSHNLELALRGMREREAEYAKTDPEKAQQAAQIIGEMTHRHEWVMNPKDSAATNALTSLGFVWYLGVSPAAALINLSQVPIVTFPVLAAKFGAGKASAALMEGMRRAIAHVNGDITRGLNEEERRAFKVWYESGAIDKSMAHGLAGLSETDTTAFNPVYRRTMEVVSWLFHKAEVVNREATALAAFRLARDSGMSEQAATKYAGEAVWESHFDYTNANRARWMQGNVAKVVFLFRQYSLNMSWFLWRNAYQALKGESKEVQRDARRKLAGVMGMTGLFSGVLGLPLASVAFGVANAAAAAFGDDEEPWDAEIAFRNFLADYLGPEAGRLITGGAVEAATGLEVSSRTSLNDLWIREPDRELEGEAMGNYILQTLAGPVGGIGFGFLRGAQLLEEGHPWRAMESMVPKFIRDGLRSLRYAEEGVNTLRGDPIIEELSLGETLAQISGFGPSRLADQYKANSAIKGYEERLLKRRQRLLNAFATAAQAGDEEAMRETLARIRRWNAEVPQLAVDRDTIDRSLRQRARYSGRAVAGTVVDQRVEARAREQARFAESSP